MDRGEQLALLSLDQEEAAALLAAVPEDERSDCWWLVLPDGSRVRGDHGGIVMLLTALRITKPVGRIAEALRMSPLFDLVDKALSKTRSRLSRIVPDGPAPRRFP